MYTTDTKGYGNVSRTYPYGARKDGYKQGSQKQKKKKTSSRRMPYGFLNTRIPAIAPNLYVKNLQDIMINVTTKENLDFLYRSAMKYAQLLNMELPYHPVNRATIREKICLLYQALDSIVSDHINLELVGDRLQFCIYHFHEWPSYTLFVMPIDFVENLRGAIKKVTQEFIRRFVRYHGLMDVTDTPYYEMSMNYFDEADSEDLKDFSRIKRLLRSYREGKIHKKMCRMYSKAFCRNLEEHIRNCNPSNNKERKLLELITEGLSLISKDSPRILSYDYDFESDRERDFTPPALEYQILFSYSFTDEVNQELERCFTADCQETYNRTPVSYTLITPETEELFIPDDYPERFYQWFEKFAEHTTKL